MRNRKRSLSPFAAGAITLVIVAIAVYLGFTKQVPFVHHYTVQAVFPTANNIRKASPVRIAGVDIGKVTKIERVAPGRPGALVTMQIKDNGLPLHKDATFKIRPRIFLEGNFFIDVQPGLAVGAQAGRRRQDPDGPGQRARPARPGPRRAAGRRRARTCGRCSTS